jgi:broad specificity phosphatase PhoE
MKTFRMLCLLAAALLPAALSTPTTAQVSLEPGTVVVVVRHAEKANDDPDDPSLDARGERRAHALADVLGDARIDAIYTTHLVRTVATAAPSASARAVDPTVRPIARGAAVDHSRALAAEIAARNAGQRVLVVGHSNTVPEIVRALTGFEIAEIPETEYEHIFIITVGTDGRPVLIRARFGEPDPPP